MRTFFLFLSLLVFLCPASHAQGLGDALAYLYPNADPISDYRVADLADGAGPKIIKWDATKLGPQPTQAQIDQAKIDLAAAREAERTARTAELNLLEQARTKLANNQALTQNELNAVLRALIRRTTTGANSTITPRP